MVIRWFPKPKRPWIEVRAIWFTLTYEILNTIKFCGTYLWSIWYKNSYKALRNLGLCPTSMIKVRYDQKRIEAETWKVRTFKSLFFRWFPSFRLWHFIEKLFCMGIFPYGRKGKSDAFKLFTSAEKAYDYYKNALDSCNVFQTALNKRPSSLRPSDLRRAGFPLIWPARSFRIVAWLWNFRVCRAELLNSGRGALFFLFFVIHLRCRTETVERLIRYEERWISFRLFLVIIFTSTFLPEQVAGGSVYSCEIKQVLSYPPAWNRGIFYCTK